MSNDAQDHNIAAIRQLLLAAFTPEDLRRFCLDRPLFEPVVAQFGPGHGLDDMVDRAIDYCRTRFLWEELLAALKDERPRQYDRFIEPEPPQADLVPPTPELLPITSPIHLELVRIPAGEFQMGSVKDKDKYAQDDEFPPHPVHVPEFHIGKYPVTNIQYQVFAQATEHRAPDHWAKGSIPSGKSDHPVVNVSWRDAHAFCNWLAQESGQPVRLPTEAEWEKAARGTDHRIYPWGDEWDPKRCNSAQGGAGTTTPVGQYSPNGDSPYGCADMAGNVLEWCQSLYRSYPYQEGNGREDVEAQGHRVLRGGSFNLSQWFVRCAVRDWIAPFNWYRDRGFRVVVAPVPSDL